MLLKEWIKTHRKIFSPRDLNYLVKNVVKRNYNLMVNQYIIDSEQEYFLKETEKLYKKGVPISYILGKEEFLGQEFKITTDTFIPRPETEILVEKAIEAIKENNFKRILDLGTGCGNIAISIKCELKRVKVFATDISFSALEVANYNSHKYNADIKFINSYLLDCLKEETFDLIISNPPYVALEDIKGSLKYEPRTSLEAKDGGFYFIQKILKEAYKFLTFGGYLIVEIGYNHRERVENLAKRLGVYKIKEWVRDYSGWWRGVILEKSS